VVTGDIPGHGKKHVNEGTRTQMVTMANSNSVQNPNSQDINTVNKYIGTGHISDIAAERMRSPDPRVDPRGPHPKPHFKPMLQTGICKMSDSYFVQDPGTQVVDFKTMGNGKPKHKMSPYTKAFRNGLKVYPDRPPKGYIFAGSHTGRCQRGQSFDETGKPLLVKERIPRAGRSAVAALMGMPGTTDPTIMLD